jgi:hypothetical protein
LNQNTADILSANPAEQLEKVKKSINQQPQTNSTLGTRGSKSMSRKGKTERDVSTAETVVVKQAKPA